MSTSDDERTQRCCGINRHLSPGDASLLKPGDDFLRHAEKGRQQPDRDAVITEKDGVMPPK
jgi:hypothetical protein